MHDKYSSSTTHIKTCFIIGDFGSEIGLYLKTVPVNCCFENLTANKLKGQIYLSAMADTQTWTLTIVITSYML